MKNTVIRMACTSLCLLIMMSLSPMIGEARIDSKSIVGIWLLDEGRGDEVADISGNGNDGKIVDAKWTEDGKFGKALEFDGKSHVEIPSSPTIDDYRDGFTYLLWVKPTAVPPNVNTRIIERDWHNPTIQIGPADFYGSISVNADQAVTNVRGGAWEQGEWSFVALTYDGQTIELYVDGEIVGSKDVGKADEASHPATPGPHQGSIWLATWKAPGWDFTGMLDDVGVFNAPLASDDIKDIMEVGLEKASAVSSAGKMAVTWGAIRQMR